jgi:ubiquinone/menaquinone biosynthesis C-methylase UbiE
MERKTQVSEGYYQSPKYDNLGRFISYYYQCEAIERLKISNLLEVGVGSGFTSTHLAGKGVKVITVDFDPLVKPDIVADIRSLPVPDDSYEAVMACQVLEHLPFSDLPQALNELKRVTKKFVVVSLPQRCSYFELVARFPFTQSLFKRNFFDWTFIKYLAFPGFSESGQHYWEIDKKLTPLPRVRKLLEEHFLIIEEFCPVLNKYHRFFILSKKDGSSSSF